jgi:drug/metabolite transporter (DMT)-like permease
MPTYEIAALLASVCFATGGMLAVAPSRALGAIRFNRIRMLMMAILLSAVAWLVDGFATISSAEVLPLVLSGLIGIYLGDTFLFAGLRRVGPRRNAMMFALNAPLAALFGVWFLDEVLPPLVLIGCLLVTAGIMVAIAFGRRRSGENPWDVVHGSLPLGLAFGLLAAAGQAGGLLLSRPLMEQGVDPIAGSAIRVLVGCLALLLTYEIQQFRKKRDHAMWTRAHVMQTFGSSFIGMGVGMTLVMFALSGGEAGVVATLSSAAPVVMLPMIWLTSQRAPAFGAWVGAAVVLVGTALVLNVK